MRFGANETLKDGSLTISFLPISYDAYGETCRESSTAMFERLLELGCDINKRGGYPYLGDNVELTVLHDAVMGEDLDLVHYLLTQGSDPLVELRMPGKKWDGLNAVELAREVSLKTDSQPSKEVEISLRQKYIKSL